MRRAAREFGLPAPKGIALIGLPGTGKSLTAKTIGALWGVPLLRLDVGAIYSSYMGESEKRARHALRKMQSTVDRAVEDERVRAEGEAEAREGKALRERVAGMVKEAMGKVEEVEVGEEERKWLRELATK